MENQLGVEVVEQLSGVLTQLSHGEDGEWSVIEECLIC